MDFYFFKTFFLICLMHLLFYNYPKTDCLKRDQLASSTSIYPFHSITTLPISTLLRPSDVETTALYQKLIHPPFKDHSLTYYRNRRKLFLNSINSRSKLAFIGWDNDNNAEDANITETNKGKRIFTTDNVLGYSSQNDEHKDNFNTREFFGGDNYEAHNRFNFNRDSLITPLLNSWKRTPPITRFYLSSSASVTLYSYFLKNNIWPRFLRLKWTSVLQGQIWRPFTCFLFLGDFGISYFLTAQFLWTYMSNLEKELCKKPEMFLGMIIFGMASLLTTYPILGLSYNMIGHNLAIFFVYIWSKLHEGQNVGVMELFEIKVEYLPWVFFAQSWIFNSEPPITDLVGIGFGAIFHYLYLYKKIEMPSIIKRIFEHPRIKKAYDKLRSEVE